MSSRSIHEVISKPPLQVTPAVGAVGKIHLTAPPTAAPTAPPISPCRNDQPAPVSPRPWSQTTPALNLDMAPTGGTKGVLATLSCGMQLATGSRARS